MFTIVRYSVSTLPENGRISSLASMQHSFFACRNLDFNKPLKLNYATFAY